MPNYVEEQVWKDVLSDGMENEAAANGLLDAIKARDCLAAGLSTTVVLRPVVMARAALDRPPSPSGRTDNSTLAADLPTMTNKRDYQGGDQFTITFTTDQHIDGIWHHCGSFDTRLGGEAAYEDLIASDIAEGAAQGQSLIGCRWRLTRERGSEVMETIYDRRMEAPGMNDLAAQAKRTT